MQRRIEGARFDFEQFVGLRADGLATAIAGCLNAFTFVSYGENVGLVSITRVSVGQFTALPLPTWLFQSELTLDR